MYRKDVCKYEGKNVRKYISYFAKFSQCLDSYQLTGFVSYGVIRTIEKLGIK